MSYLSASWNVIGFNKYWALFIPPICGYYFGKYLDDEERARSTTFRDKSALFGGNVKEGDPPTWGPGSLHYK